MTPGVAHGRNRTGETGDVGEEITVLVENDDVDYKCPSARVEDF